MDIKETSIVVDEGGNSQALGISTTSAKSAVITSGTAVVTLSAAAFVRQGSDPTAVSDGTDQYLLADVAYRLNLKPGNKLAFKTASGTGTAYITPER